MIENIKTYNNKKYIVNDKTNNYALENLTTEKKHYIREGLSSCENQLIFVKSTFKEIHDNHITFGNIRPYVDGTATYILCNHVNILKRTVQKYINIHSLEKGKKYYIFGYVKKYGNENERYGIELAENIEVSPIFEIHKLTTKEINYSKEKAYKFNPNAWLRRKYIN